MCYQNMLCPIKNAFNAWKQLKEKIIYLIDIIKMVTVMLSISFSGQIFVAFRIKWPPYRWASECGSRKYYFETLALIPCCLTLRHLWRSKPPTLLKTLLWRRAHPPPSTYFQVRYLFASFRAHLSVIDTGELSCSYHLCVKKSPLCYCRRQSAKAFTRD